MTVQTRIQPQHPAIARQLGFAKWTDDPAVQTLLAIGRDLARIGQRLVDLNTERPDCGAYNLDVGAVTHVYERTRTMDYGYGWRFRANGGICADLWTTLDTCRMSWINARLDSERFADWNERSDRELALHDEAPSVEDAWRSASRELFGERG